MLQARPDRKKEKGGEVIRKVGHKPPVERKQGGGLKSHRRAKSCRITSRVKQGEKKISQKGQDANAGKPDEESKNMTDPA